MSYYLFLPGAADKPEQQLALGKPLCRHPLKFHSKQISHKSTSHKKIQVEVKGGEVVVIQRYSRKFLLRREISMSATMSKTVWRVHKQRHGLQVQSVDDSITELFSIQVTPRQRHLNQARTNPRLSWTAAFRMDPRPGASRRKYEGDPVWALTATAGCEPKKPWRKVTWEKVSGVWWYEEYKFTSSFINCFFPSVWRSSNVLPFCSKNCWISFQQWLIYLSLFCSV